MFKSVLKFFRRRRIRKYCSGIPTGFVAMQGISSANVIIDVEEQGFDLLKEDILVWGRQNGIKVNIYFFDFRKLGKDELLLTSIQTTIIKKELDWIGMPPFAKVEPLIQEPSDLFISLVDNGNFPIEFLSKCAKARFKIGRRGFEGDAYNMVVVGNRSEGLNSESREIFRTITEFLTKIK